MGYNPGEGDSEKEWEKMWEDIIGCYRNVIQSYKIVHNWDLNPEGLKANFPNTS